jgi:uncharacterized phage protein (predicted DNA packaging)
MKLSDLEVEIVKMYLRVTDDFEDEVIEGLIQAAKAAVLTETGLTEQEADALPDVTIAALAMIADLYENRGMTAANAARNPTVDAILTAHRSNMVL